jgi:ElaB/YqjD/DUF883 family membrane-anchored ribosome-binding protein
MKRKVALMLLIGAVALCLVGCAEDEEVATTTDQNDTTARQAPEAERGVQPVPEGGVAGTPGGAPGTDAMAQQKTEYVEGAQKMLNNMEQKLTAWQQQAGTQQDQKMQDLAQQTQQQITQARDAVDKMRTATGDQLKDAKVAADQAIQSAEQSFKNLQSYASQVQVTQEQ